VYTSATPKNQNEAATMKRLVCYVTSWVALFFFSGRLLCAEDAAPFDCDRPSSLRSFNYE